MNGAVGEIDRAGATVVTADLPRVVLPPVTRIAIGVHGSGGVEVQRARPARPVAKGAKINPACREAGGAGEVVGPHAAVIHTDKRPVTTTCGEGSRTLIERAGMATVADHNIP